MGAGADFLWLDAGYIVSVDLARWVSTTAPVSPALNSTQLHPNLALAMSPTIEIVKFVAKDSYKQDPTILNDALEILKNTSGTSGYVSLE